MPAPDAGENRREAWAAAEAGDPAKLARNPEYVGIVNLAIPAHGGRPGAYSYSPRSDEPTEDDLRGSTLRTGYCDRKIDVTDKRNSNSDILVRDVNFSESEISGIYGRDGPTTHTVRRLTPPGI